MSGGLAAANVALPGSVAEDVGLWKVDEVDVTSELSMLLGKGDGLSELLMGIALSAIVSAAVALAEEEPFVLLVGNTAVDVIKTNGFRVEYGETVAVEFLDTDSDDTASNVANFERVVTSEVVLKACLLVKLSEVAVCVAEHERLADPLPEKTRATAVLEF